MISNSGTASSTSFFTLLPSWHLYTSNLEVHLQLTISLNNFLSLLYLSLTLEQLKTSFLIDCYLQLLHCRTDEALPWYLDNCSTGKIAIKNSCASCCVLSANCGNSTLTACLACTGCITFPSVLCTNFSIANTCSRKFLLLFLTSCYVLYLADYMDCCCLYLSWDFLSFPVLLQ